MQAVMGASAKQASGKILSASIVAEPAVPMSQGKEPPLIRALETKVNSHPPMDSPSVFAWHNPAQASMEARYCGRSSGLPSLAGTGRKRGGSRDITGEGMKGVIMAETVNLEIAQRLEAVAQLLDEQGVNPSRVQAYRNAAQTLRQLDRPITEILQHNGIDGLRQLPGIGESLAHSIHALATTG